MAVAAIMANVSRILAWWRSVEWRAVAAYAATGIPGAALGARTMLVLPPRAVDAAIGGFLLLMIPARRWLAARLIQLRLPHLAIAGGIIGFLTGIVVSTGPASVPVPWLWPDQGRLPGDRGGGVAGGLSQQDGDVPRVWGAAGERRAQRADGGRVADGRRLHRQTLSASAFARHVQAHHGRLADGIRHQPPVAGRDGLTGLACRSAPASGRGRSAPVDRRRPRRRSSGSGSRER